MDNRVRINEWEWRYLKRKFRKMIRIKDVTKRWIYGRNIVNRFYVQHCTELSITFIDEFQSLMTSVNWGTTYFFRRVAYQNLIRVLQERYLKVIEFEEVA